MKTIFPNRIRHLFPWMIMSLLITCGCKKDEPTGPDVTTINVAQYAGVWTGQNSGTSNLLRTCSFVDANNGTVVGNNGTIIRTTDGGTTWVTQSSGTSNALYGVSFVDANIGWAVGVGGVMRHTGKTVLVGVKEKAIAEIPQQFSLSQNYPNPFNPSTKIRFRVASFGFVSLKVYNILGQEAATLVNEELSPGSYEVKWDAAAFSSGVYFYRLTANNFVEAKKLVLMR